MNEERNVNIVVVGDMNTAAGRALTAALMNEPDIVTPYRFVHIDEVRNSLPGIRATPAVGVVLWATDLQEVATISDVLSLSNFVAAQSDYESIAEYALQLEYENTLNEMGVSENDL